MKKGVKDVLDIVLRYLVLVVCGILNTTIFYFLFTSLTIYPVFFLLRLFFETSLTSSSILTIRDIPIEIIGACVAGSAYYLLLMLNLSTRGIKFTKRILVMVLSFALLLVFNILRIFCLSVILVSGNAFFDVAHEFFWYVGSVLFVVLIWFFCVKKFNIKEIPFYSDVLFLLSHSKKDFLFNHSGKKAKKSKRSNKH